MLGGSCSPCCVCNCATRCTFCFEMSDGVTTWNSCTSAMHDGLAPTRIDICQPLTTQPLVGTAASVALGRIGAILEPMRLSAPPPPFQPVNMGAFGGTGYFTGQSDGDGFFYGKSQGSSVTSGSYSISRTTSVLLVVVSRCLDSSLVLPARHIVNVLYRVVITRAEQPISFGSGLRAKFQRTEISSFQGGAQFGYGVRSAATGAGLVTPVIGCTGAVHFCNSTGSFSLSNFSIEASTDGITVSINDGLATASLGQLPTTLQTCVTQNIDGSDQQACNDFISLGDALFTPPVITGFATNTGDCPDGNPLP